MSTTDVPVKGSFRGISDLPLRGAPGALRAALVLAEPDRRAADDRLLRDLHRDLRVHVADMRP